MEAQTRGGGGDDTVGFTENAEDVFPFDLFESGAALDFRRGIPYFADGGAEVGSDGEDDGPLDKVFQFADVAGPAPVDQGAHGFGWNLVDDAAHFFGVLAGEVTGEKRDVVGAIAKGRGGDGEDLEAVVEIAAEEFVAHHFGEVSIGGGDQTDIDGDGANATEAFERFFLEGTEKLGLEVERDVADFIEEEGAAVGHFEASDLLGKRAGEGATFVAEEFAFEETGGNGGAVECDEG